MMGESADSPAIEGGESMARASTGGQHRDSYRCAQRESGLLIGRR